FSPCAIEVPGKAESGSIVILATDWLGGGVTGCSEFFALCFTACSHFLVQSLTKSHKTEQNVHQRQHFSPELCFFGAYRLPYTNFDAEISAVVAETVWDTPERQKHLSESIVEHLYRQGMLSVAEDLCQESGVVIDMNMKQPFLELNRILEALRMQDLRPALEWAVTNRQRLLELNSSLEFKLHRMYFISLLSGGIGNQVEALQYSRHFQPFASQHQRDIQILMGSLVYLRHGIENSPYRSLLETSQWAEICNIFTRDACALLGLSVESPLSVSFASGCMALPVLMNIKQVIEQRQCSGVWTHKDELPIEIDLGKKCWYHSVFACPILRQQTSESNPPMKLICGHVISRDALNKLTNAGKYVTTPSLSFLSNQLYHEWRPPR
uniref:Required for meiotic nuclear division 5 homolog B n=1 Tax=Nothobranchius furzeri TaxID=105023 RepID=A0A8C6MB53_NOTFU